MNDARNDAGVVLQALIGLAAGHAPNAIHTQTGIPKLVAARVRSLARHAPDLLVKIGAGEICVTAAHQLLKERQAQPCP